MPLSTGVPSHLPLLVVDKSFAQSSRAPDLAALTDTYIHVVPDAFYHEVFTTDARKRLCALTGFPEFRRLHIAGYLKKERQSGVPTAGIDPEELDVLTFNPDLLSPDWILGPDHQPIIDQYAAQVVSPSIEFWTNVIKIGVPTFTGEEITSAQRSPECLLALCATIRDPARVRAFAAETNFPHADKLDPAWFHFRMYQAWMMQGLILIHRYSTPGVSPNLERIEHDLNDLEYLILGLITGNLATAETNESLGKASMGWRFKFLLPEGNLVTPIHLATVPR